MIQMMKCGFRGGPARQNSKKQAGQMILNLNGEVVWPSFDHYREAHCHPQINGPASCLFSPRTNGHSFADTTKPKKK